MQVFEIKMGDSSFIDGLLEKGIHSDVYFDDYPVRIRLKPDDWFGYVYRELWETVYLKRPGSSIVHKPDINNPNTKESEVNLRISLSEAIGFIYAATPPRLQNQIPDSIKSIESIKGLLETFLMDDSNPEKVHYHSIFKDYTHFNQFSTIWKCDNSKVKLLREAVDHGMIGVVLYSGISFGELIESEEKYVDIAMVLHIKTQRDAMKLRRFLNDHNLHIDNLCVEDNELYVLTTSSDFYCNKETQEFFKKSYKRILGG